MNIETIGTVKSTVMTPVDENWGNVISEIHLRTDLAKGLQGLEKYSHAIIIFLMHQTTFNLASDLIRRPRGRSDMPQIGIFAQRARHRPNPIGITAVEIIQVYENVLKVKGLDAIDGTLVLDIKPYVPMFDLVEDAEIPHWIKKLMKGYF